MPKEQFQDQLLMPGDIQQAVKTLGAYLELLWPIGDSTSEIWTNEPSMTAGPQTIHRRDILLFKFILMRENDLKYGLDHRSPDKTAMPDHCFDTVSRAIMNWLLSPLKDRRGSCEKPAGY